MNKTIIYNYSLLLPEYIYLLPKCKVSVQSYSDHAVSAQIQQSDIQVVFFLKVRTTPGNTYPTWLISIYYMETLNGINHGEDQSKIIKIENKDKY